MTDEAKALVERLRWGAWYYKDPFDGKAYASDDPLEAADLIETQASEIERLRGHLKEIAAECVVTVGTDQQMYSRWRAIAVKRVDIARAALAGDSHDQ